ncbi:putative ankyrin repeat protein [Fusarium sporotrichioides]|uniref:Putative ankyrin repeat protein n=1 Tax=Fusarium sporotrichioides TaxID=5514 RepID=A0A395RRZ1_FUSSP|nr:putative ankyrin repeat protein [Fusarium sporotrichioides]
MDEPKESPDGLIEPSSESGDQPSPKPSLALDTNVNGTYDTDFDQESDDDAISIETTTDQLLHTEPEASREHKLGLDINPVWGWSGSAYDDFDLITVHGIRDDYKTVWMDSNGKWFLKSQVFEFITVREIDYSYEIHQNAILYQPNGIRILAQNLLDEYVKVREKLEETEVDRPIIWVCHDLGGTIVKEALSMAAQNPVKYGKISMLTTCLLFLGVPHRFESQDELEDQLHKLILLPGPKIKNMTLIKVKNLARQVSRANIKFLATKLFDKACIFNYFIQDIPRSRADNPGCGEATSAGDDDYADEQIRNAVTPFKRYAHFVGHSLEAAGRSRSEDYSHLDLVRERGGLELSDMSHQFNQGGYPLRIGYRILPLQTRLLSLLPPTRAMDIPFDPILPEPPELQWIYQHESYTWFMKQRSGSKILHLHGDGNPVVDVSEVSRLFYASHDSYNTRPTSSAIYFEFDRNDSRYSTLSSLLIYLINVLSSHFWNQFESFIHEELVFLSDTRAWTLQDLYHIYSRFRSAVPNTHDMTLFIGCFDQCSLDQRRWFISRLLSDHSYSTATNRIIFTTSFSDGLGVENIPYEKHVNLSECPSFSQRKPHDMLPMEFESGLNNLITARPIYNEYQSQILELLQKCNNVRHFGHLILNWLSFSHRGSSKKEIAASIKSLFPVSPETVVDAFLSSLQPGLKAKAETAFNWIKNAAEPWSPDALIEAIKVYRYQDEELTLDDLDKEAETAELVEALGGIIIIQDDNVKFSHPLFYSVTRLSKDQSAEESTAQIHSQVATACLQYFQLESAQKMLGEFSSANFGGSWLESPLNTVVICHPRDSFAVYAVRFWPHHYKLSGQFRPKQLVRQLFSNKQARTAWDVNFWLLSNSFTRSNRNYISMLPVFARLGLEDLFEEELQSENSHPWFNVNCWYSIIEAIRAGSKPIVDRLLEQVGKSEEGLKDALFWAAARENNDILYSLLPKVNEIKPFSWPEILIYRAAATGKTDLLATMLDSGVDIDRPGTYWGAPPSIAAAWRNQVSALELILKSEPKPDLAAVDGTGDSLLMSAVRLGNPQLIKPIVDAGAAVKDDPKGQELVREAIESCSHEAVDILLKAGVELGLKDDADDAEEPPLPFAAAKGLLECVRVMLRHKADPDVNGPFGTALYRAVEKGHLDIVRLLLENDPKPSMEIVPPNQDALLIRAICTGNTELVSLLIQHGVRIDFVDPNGDLIKTPLSRACKEGDLDMVKLLLENKADVNYTGDVPGSDSPLFTALYNDQLDIARYLLQIESVDVAWRGSDGMGALHGAFSEPEVLSDLLQRKIPVDSPSIWGTPLHMAARQSQTASIGILLKHDPKPDLEAVMGDDASDVREIGLTPLQLACRKLDLACIKVLLEAGANPQVVTDDNDIVDIVLLEGSGSQSCEKVLKLLLSEPYNLPIDRVNHDGRTRLHIIRETTSVAVCQLLMGPVSRLDARDNHGYTPLGIAILMGNRDVAEYLIEQGATVNILSPNYGSILHLATKHGSLDLVKLLVRSGADPDLVDVEYGESILYTALGIKGSNSLFKMVRYLVDEEKVPVNKMGGELAYPVIKAADLTRQSPYSGITLLRFLIRRNARLDVADSQGRQAVHFACMPTALSTYAIKILVNAGADKHCTDKFGRRPIHFAASSPDYSRLWDYFEELEASDIDVKDHDGWTPLMWAARSGSAEVIKELIDRKADIWAQSDSSKEEKWSALKLANFAGRSPWIIDELMPKELSRTTPDGGKEMWDEYAHKSKAGHAKGVACDSCLVEIIGLQWECIECSERFSLCFKCFPHKSDLHNPDHNFKDIGPLYADESEAGSTTSHDTQEAISKDEEGSGSSEGVEVDLDQVDIEDFDLDLEDDAD